MIIIRSIDDGFIGITRSWVSWVSWVSIIRLGGELFFELLRIGYDVGAIVETADGKQQASVDVVIVAIVSQFRIFLIEGVNFSLLGMGKADGYTILVEFHQPVARQVTDLVENHQIGVVINRHLRLLSRQI